MFSTGNRTFFYNKNDKTTLKATLISFASAKKEELNQFFKHMLHENFMNIPYFY